MQLGDKKLIVQRASMGSKAMVGAPATLQVSKSAQLQVFTRASMGSKIMVGAPATIQVSKSAQLQILYKEPAWDQDIYFFIFFRCSIFSLLEASRSLKLFDFVKPLKTYISSVIYSQKHLYCHNN